MRGNCRPTRLFVAYFEDESAILDATRSVRERGLQIHDVYTPYAVHGLDHAMGLRPSRLTWVCFVGAMAGALLGGGLQYYTSVTSWPLIVGGKPFNSAPAFVPVTFELAVLLGALSTVAIFLLSEGLLPGRKRRVQLPGITDDRFALCLEPADPHFDERLARTLLLGAGATELGFWEVSS